MTTPSTMHKSLPHKNKSKRVKVAMMSKTTTSKQILIVPMIYLIKQMSLGFLCL